MFRKFFGRKPPQTPSTEARDAAIARGLLKGIAEKSAADPQIGAKVGAKDIVHRLTTTMAAGDAGRVHAETIIAILGSLAGYACVVSALSYVAGIRERLAGPDRDSVKINGIPIATVGGERGLPYLTGDAINGPLFSASHSVLKVIYGRASIYGVTALPDVSELSIHVMKTMDTPEFGVPRIGEAENAPNDRPVNYVKAFWPIMAPIARLYCPNEADWPLLFALAAQEAIEMCKQTLPPAVAMRLAIECAVPMSRLNPAMLG